MLGIAVPILAAFFACILGLRLADWAGWFPRYSDDAGLQHQVRQANSRHPAQIVFVGDSTCWCGIDPTEFSRQIPGRIPAVNLSLFIWFDLDRYAEQAADFARSNPGQVKWVVLLVCGAKPSNNTETPDYAARWSQLQSEHMAEVQGPRRFWGQDDLFDSNLMRERLAPLILPQALRNRGAGYFGFMNEMSAFMTAHNGGRFDIGEYVPAPNHVLSDYWHLAPQFFTKCQDFRGKMPAGAKLAIGFTPASLGDQPRGSHPYYLACLKQWKDWINADLVLTNLPELLPPPCFAPGGHLNALGQEMFTSAVAKEFAPVLRSK